MPLTKIDLGCVKTFASVSRDRKMRLERAVLTHSVA
jgi:hypothetical protein